jgi:FkbM family methyltransferase
VNFRAIKKILRRSPLIWRAFRESDQWLDLTLEYGGFRRVAYPCQLEFRNGLKLTLNDRDELIVMWHVFFRRCYHVDPLDRVIVDCGANIGMFALYAAQAARGAEILSIEPMPNAFARLENHVRCNGLTGRVQCVNSAVGGSESMRVMDGRDRSTTLKFMYPPGTDRTGITVKCLRLDSLMAGLGSRRINLLKMDIEGSEFETLLATDIAQLARVDRMDIEMHTPDDGNRQSREELLRHLSRAGHLLEDMEEDVHGYGVAYFRHRDLMRP